MATTEANTEINNEPCTCMSPDGLCCGKFLSTWVGIDETNGRFGEVSIRQCHYCKRQWLHYFVEYEHLSQSGRWYRGIIDDEIAQILTQENAAEILSNLEWHFYGGSYFFGKFGRSRGQIYVS
ncbi:hypothetical protein NIES2101_36720 [Calothrix sp. HK-06]|nr:hypothetical protein NIES2101_36720 [Calothrix sp. HK-06]